MGLAGLFAMFHGQAHGAEMPASASALGYAAGFMMATALLHVAGVATGFGMGRISAPAVRMAGAAASVAGVVLLVSAV
jgi:urease accessory protein